MATEEPPGATGTAVASALGIDPEGHVSCTSVWSRLDAAHAALGERLDRALRERHGLPLLWYETLTRLAAAGGQLRMTELTSGLPLTKSGITRLVDRLEAAGLLSRRVCDHDRRGVWAELTVEGRSRVDTATPTYTEVLDDAAAELSDVELATLQNALMRLG